MKVSEIMSRDVAVANVDETMQEAAAMMAAIGAGVVPVGDNDRLVGMLTDRDIAIRGVARGKGPATPVRDVMSADVKYCFEDEDIEHVTRNLGDIQVRRLPVVNRDKKLVGILSLGDISITHEGIGTAEALNKISQPGGQHSQS